MTRKGQEVMTTALKFRTSEVALLAAQNLAKKTRIYHRDITSHWRLAISLV
jgi:hypothetical protein